MTKTQDNSSQKAKSAPKKIEPASGNKEPEKKKNLSWYEALQQDDEELLKAGIADELKNILKKYSLDNYLALLLYDAKDAISNYHSNSLHRAVSKNDKKQDVLLIIHSDGGSIEPAYLASKSLKHFAKTKFVASVPRKAKSAATLICLGADEIHMGITSQLGPIDPQIGGFPALGLVNALDTLAGLTKRFPESSSMLAQYLEAKLDLRILGYFNRVTESATQYAERLLKSKKLPLPPQQIADHLVNHYKDHGFVIDLDEASHLLGNDMVRIDTPEYAAANEIFEFFEFIEYLLDKKKKKAFWYCGNIDSGMYLYNK